MVDASLLEVNLGPEQDCALSGAVARVWCTSHLSRLGNRPQSVRPDPEALACRCCNPHRAVVMPLASPCSSRFVRLRCSETRRHCMLPPEKGRTDKRGRRGIRRKVPGRREQEKAWHHQACHPAFSRRITMTRIAKPCAWIYLGPARRMRFCTTAWPSETWSSWLLDILARRHWQEPTPPTKFP